ncbi:MULTISPECIES: CpsD/CapB family tyrosine-protein kinase [unclassified Roseovarius]|uniref:CpsD/CapB family tyrosine-protein kinase n=1 Tax=unclassified Roseovarius TaxID=2614913 RepID=UPI00273F5590|nr:MULTISPECIES: CpsD/CapB family tyrosine-protein kinase [unclassified Roseovarius]
MERIQSALNKARKARQEQRENQNREAAAPASESTQDAPLETYVIPKDMSVASREEVWKRIPAFHPKEKQLASSRIVAYRSSHDSVPYDVMRTKLLHQMRANKWSRVAIVSPSQGAGKTLTCVNLAFSLARQTNFFAALIELDMRRPALAKALKINDDCQFSRVLSGEDPAEMHLRRYGKNLFFGCNKNTVRNPAELLQGANAGKVVDEIEAQFQPDIMVFDTPPVFAGDDTLAFLDQVDCVLLVAEAEKSTIEEIDKCEQELAARTNVLGVVLNKCRYLSKHEEYGKEYS